MMYIIHATERNFWRFQFFPLINTFPQTYLSNCQHHQSLSSVQCDVSTLYIASPIHRNSPKTRTISHGFKFVQNNSSLKVTVDLFMRFSTISWLESFNFWNLYCMFDKCTHLYVNVFMVTTLTTKKHWNLLLLAWHKQLLFMFKK